MFVSPPHPTHSPSRHWFRIFSTAILVSDGKMGCISVPTTLQPKSPGDDHVIIVTFLSTQWLAGSPEFKGMQGVPRGDFKPSIARGKAMGRGEGNSKYGSWCMRLQAFSTVHLLASSLQVQQSTKWGRASFQGSL